MSSKLSDRKRRGFTLVEMLVVITIISILASLVLVGAAAARRAANRASIKTEIDQLSGAFQEYKQQNGSFPPNAIVKVSAFPASLSQAAVQNRVVQDLQRHFKEAFPKHQEPDALFAALAGVDGQLVDQNNQPHGMSAAEAIYFWLGGFSKDARYPISGKGGPSFVPGGLEDLEGRQPIFSFDLARLGPRDEGNNFVGRFIEYQVNYNGQPQRRRINLWTYAPRGYEETLQYFDTSRYTPAEYDPMSGLAELVALKTLPSAGIPSSASSAQAAQLVQFANPKSFQILHAGIDDEWGNFMVVTFPAIESGNGILYPTGPFTEELADTQVNFSTETLEDSQP